ncbi:hypothetical protein G6N05_15285 [Flavobacterium sp. F372]|uniref:Lipoprotein n=1 Tax=Flavobacterium bernardetii TaxID=2813823 RepID=A0ABR7J2H0_9FLAO|nr:hypothetical protein [Flavobacterium bernardetii]MBC5836250.1 hypothetical protein [Flavobacterium bernardetii]NHF71476.1 hypothetical protein [Flavobacterium bernardetii]
MRIIILLFVLLASCSKKNEDKLIDSKFQKINYSLKYNYLDSIGKKIIPNENFNYWAYSTYYERYGDGKISQTILKEGGNKILKKSITEKFKPYGIFEGGHPSYRCNYVTIIENQKVKYIRTDEELRNFIGDIDNIEEAILLARTYGYQLDTELKARQYKKIENGYQLRLMKYHEFPLSKELIDVKIQKNGFIKTRSLGIYKKGREAVD